jgi:fatty acid desaturase
MSSARVLSGAEVRSLSTRSDLHGTLRLAAHAAFIALGAWLVAAAAPLTLLPAMLVLGTGLSTLFAPIHETMHLTAFASRRANAVVGWLAACPSLLNWHFYAAFHLAHHRHTQDPARDPELAPPPPTDWNDYFARVSGLNYWCARLAIMLDCWRGNLAAYPYIPARAAPKIIRSVRAMTLFMLALSALSVAVIGWWAPLVFWIGPQLLAQPFLRLYLLTEHTGCTLDANGLTNTRTTLTNAAMRLLMWNMSFHAEHHLYPSIPFHRLPDAHAAVRDRLAVVQDGYVSWHVRFARSLQPRASVRP